MLKSMILAGSLASTLFAVPASAQEAFGGLFLHGVDTPFSMETEQEGTDIQIGYRLAPVEELHFIGKPAPYVIASLNTNGDTSFVGVGLSWKIGIGPLYVRPEIGVAMHDGPSSKITPAGKHVDMGSRVLLEPGLSIGRQVSARVSVEASWVHLSHGGVCNGKQNPGLDMWGLRLNLKL